MARLLRIGEFAALAGVSVKAVRYYESEGLLRPSHVDPHTAYRYFSVDQCGRLALITNLRAAGFGIQEILAVLTGDGGTEQIRDLVAEKRRALIESRALVDHQLATLDTLAMTLRTADEDPWSAVKLTSASDELVYSQKSQVPHLGDPVTEIFEAAESKVARAEARAERPPFLIFHDPPERQRDLLVEVCIPLRKDARERLDATVVAGCDRGCSVVYAGSYAQTEPLCETMMHWIAGAGLQPAGPLREIFHRFGADQSDYRLPNQSTTNRAEEFITELLLPIQPYTPPHL